MASEPPNPKLEKRLCLLIKERFINETPNGSFESAIYKTLVDVGLDLSSENQIIFWREYQKLQMEWTLGSPVKIEEVFSFNMHSDLNMNHALHLDVWIHIFKLLSPKEMRVFKFVCRSFHAILNDQIFFGYKYASEESSAVQDVAGSEDLKLLRKSKDRHFSYCVKSFLKFVKCLSLIFPSTFTYCTRPDGSMFFLYQHQADQAASPFGMLKSNLLKVNMRFEKYAFFLIQEHILRNIKSLQEFNPTKLPSFRDSKLPRDNCSKVLCDIADILIDDPHVEDQVIQNFLKQCFKHRPISWDYGPLNPRILVLISRLPEETALVNLRKLYGVELEYNNCLALISGCCRADLIDKKKRELYIEEMTGFTIDLNCSELLTEMADLWNNIFCFGVGSKYILEFISVDLFSQVLKLGCGYSDLRWSHFVISIDQLEDFLQGKGIFHESDIMFEYIKSLDTYEDWPIYLNWAIYKVAKKMINMDNKKAVDLILSILQNITESSSIEVKRIAGKFAEAVLETYPELIWGKRERLLKLNDF